MRFTVPSSVECTCSLDDSAMLAEMGLTRIGRDGRKRLILEGSEQTFRSIVQTCMLMAEDHGAEDASQGMYYTNNAAQWARRQTAKLTRTS